MGKLLTNFGLTFLLSLSVLGALYILQQITTYLQNYNCFDINPTIVLITKDIQNQIEGIVRNYYRNLKKRKDLCIIDIGSQDQTKEILEKISLKYPGIKVIFCSDIPSELCFEKLKLVSESSVTLFIDTTELEYEKILKLLN